MQREEVAFVQVKRKNPKLEYRNPKHARRIKIQNQKPSYRTARAFQPFGFRVLKWSRIPGFGFRGACTQGIVDWMRAWDYMGSHK
jgi:hypothetical protein